MDKNAAKIISIYNDFTGQNSELLDQFYHPEVVFQDPVTTILGLANLKKYYAHAYARVKSIRFEFSEIAKSGELYTAPWTMHLEANGLNSGKLYSVDGVSLIHFDKADLVIKQRDYLDLGDMVYERLPVQGPVIKLIKKFLKS